MKTTWLIGCVCKSGDTFSLAVLIDRGLDLQIRRCIECFLVECGVMPAPTVGKTSAGAIEYMPVARLTNIVKTMEMLKKEGLWFACADMGENDHFDTNMKGPIGLVIGSEGEGVSRLVREKCDYIASIPMKGDIDSLNASVAAGVLSYEIVRQRLGK